MKSRQVRVWSIMTNVSSATKKKSYTARWAVAGQRKSRTFATRALADNFRTDLKQAVNAGEAFDVETGLPESMAPKEVGVTWLELTQKYVEMKWPDAAANSRRGMIESLVAVTVVLVSEAAPPPPETTVLRMALRELLVPGTPEPTEVESIQALRWLRDYSIPAASLTDLAVVRTALNAVAKQLDGNPAAPSTRRRKRAIFYNVVEYGIELGLLDHNPIDRIRVRSRRRAISQTVDRQVVANVRQVRELLTALTYVGGRIRDRGLRLVAFFACLYFAGLRPEEAKGLRKRDCYLPARCRSCDADPVNANGCEHNDVEYGWGRLTLAVARPEVGKQWTNSGERHDERGLKHRPDDETRPVPIPSELVRILRWHIATFGVTPDGRLFSSTKGGVLGSGTYSRVWAEARRLALTPEQFASILASRPYDLRHACLSLWFNCGVPATEVAKRAGQSVKVLLEIYAKCIDGDEEIINARIERALS